MRSRLPCATLTVAPADGSRWATTRAPRACTRRRTPSGADALTPEADRHRIVADSTNPIFFTNRAFSRLKLQAWDEAINDCLKSIELHGQNMKAYYYLAQAQISLHHANEGLNSALTAYDICLRSGSPGDAASVSALVLRAKREKWEARERERLRRRSELLAELEDRLDAARRDEVAAIEERAATGELDATEAREEAAIAEDISRKKLDELKSVFTVADPENMQRRVSVAVLRRWRRRC